MSIYFDNQQDEGNDSYGPSQCNDDSIIESDTGCHTSSEIFIESSGTSDVNNDTADAESGVEPDSSEWIFQDTVESVEFDITAEQAMATLRYFTSTAERVNILSKTHHDDLDVISSLLQEKEKDLEMAARIGQSLLQRNKQLLLKIEAMEDYMTSACEKENQMRYEVNMKSELLKRILREEQEFELMSVNSDSGSGNSFGAGNCQDESMMHLEKKCKNLEVQNEELLHDAVSLKHLANQAEDEEQDLVVDCLKQLSYAKDQITHLTDEIALKFEDNVAQQDEISQLITTVVELQRKQKVLAVENDDLQYQLDESQQGQECLRSQVIDLERKLQECCDMLRENQDEVKDLRTKVERTDTDPWDMSLYHSSNISQHDSLALEIEESVKRELTASDRNKEKTSRVLEIVKKANRFLSPGSNYSPAPSLNISSSASFRSQSSVDSDDRSVTSLSTSRAGSQEFDDSRRRKGYIPAEKLQIIKPMEGSLTLHKWHHLASENVVAGLNVGNVLTPQKATEEMRELSPRTLSEHSSAMDTAELPTDTRLEDLDNDIFEEEDEDFGISFKTDNKTKKDEADPKGKQSTPVHASQQSMESLYNSAQSIPAENENSFDKPGELSSLDNRKSTKPDRSIITRNSSLLASLREGRAMLTKDGASGKSRTDAIDILAHAMSRANVQAKTGQRILESVNENSSRSRAPSSVEKREYPDMPKLKKVLERLTANTGSGKVDLSAVQPALKLLLEKASGASGSKVGVHKPQTDSTIENGSAEKHAESLRKKNAEKKAVSKPDVVIPALLRGPAALRATPGILGNILQSSGNENVGTSMLSTVLSSTANSASGGFPAVKPTLTRSWSSGDLNSFSKDNLTRLNYVNSSVDQSSFGRLRQSSGSGVNLAALANDTTDEPLRRRRNSSGSLVDLVKQANLNAISGSPPNTASFLSFDNYGVEDFSSKIHSGPSSSASNPQATTTTASNPQATTTTASNPQATTTTASSKPAGFLRNLFLGSASSNETPVEPKRPSSVIEGPSSGISLGAGSSASAESGMDRFGKSLAQDGFSGFGFGFMSYFSSKK